MLTQCCVFKFSDYHIAIHNFECSLLELVGFKDAALIHEVLVKCFKNIEANIQQNQNYQLQVETLILAENAKIIFF